MSMTSINQVNTTRKKGYSSSNQSRSSSPPKRSPTEYTSSEGLPDEVFAMFIEDDYKDDSEEEEDIEHINESEFFGSDDTDDDSSVEDGFNGWTDQEIIKARFASKINQELDLLHVSKSSK